MRFFETVCRWADEPDEEILVFHAGQWMKDERLFASIRDATFDNLVMSPAIKAEIADDAARLLRITRTIRALPRTVEARRVVRRTAGNGKTHAAKAIVNDATVPCVYVRSFDLPGHPFRARGRDGLRKGAPSRADASSCSKTSTRSCATSNRQYSCNELDGSEQNDGHARRLPRRVIPNAIDAAILRRSEPVQTESTHSICRPFRNTGYVELWNGGRRTNPSVTWLEDIAGERSPNQIDAFWLAAGLEGATRASR